MTSPHATPLTPEQHSQERNRLADLGELLIDISRLIDLLHSTNQATQIDHELHFALSPENQARLPEAIKKFDPSFATVTASFERQPGEDMPRTHLSIDIIAGSKTLKITRDGSGPRDRIVDILFDTSRTDTAQSLRDEIRGESSDDFERRLTAVPSTSRAELNGFLMSLAFPNNKEFSHFDDKNLLDAKALDGLVGVLAENAASAQSRGLYRFENDANVPSGIAGTLTFEKNDESESFVLTFIDPKTLQEITVSGESEPGMSLSFATFSEGVITYFNPTNKELQYVHQLLKNELSGVDISPAETDVDDPEAIALKNVQKRDKKALKRLAREVGHALNQDGFNPPNTGA